jgi:butyrate kinase
MSTRPLLVINLGAVSSKIALFDADKPIVELSFLLDDVQAKLPLKDQRELRLDHVRRFITESKLDTASLAAIAARGGLMKPLARSGVYRVDQSMVDDLLSERFGSHPASLSAPIGYDIAAELGTDVPVFVVDPISTDTIWDEARVAGVPEVQRFGRHHALNVHRAARHAAQRLGKPLHECSFVIGHFGSGVSICSVAGGRVVDVNDAQLGEGPFSVARAGTLPIRGVLDLAYGGMERKKLEQYLSRAAGLCAYVGTSDFREVEKMLDAGDAKAHAAYQAMVFQSVKYLAAAAGALGAKPDGIVLTGGLLKSKRFCEDLAHGVAWLARVEAFPGEDEMAALAEGVNNVLIGREPAYVYAEAEQAGEVAPRDFPELVKRAAHTGGCRFVVAGGHLGEIAETVRYCAQRGIHGFTLVGPEAETQAMLAAEGVDTNRVVLVDSAEIVPDAVSIVRSTPGSVLVKGNCNTAALLKAVLDCLPKENRPFLSHIAVLESPAAGRLMAITDGGLNLDPDRDKKIGIMENAIAAFRALGVKRPHVMLAAGMEDKGQDIPAIADAREIVKRHRAGEWAHAVIDGPFGFDVAINAEAAAIKGIKSPVAGRADIMLTPNLESCNFAIKAAVFYSGRPWAGLVIGGPFPVIVGSRGDDAASRVASIALAQLVAAGMAGAAQGKLVADG